MKYIITILLAFLFISGCSKKSDETKLTEASKYQVDSSDIKAQPLENQNQAFTMQYKLEKGKTYRYRLTTVTNDSQTITADTTISSNIKQTIIYLISLTPVSTDKDGVTEINCVFNSVKLNALANGQEYNYESTTNTDSLERNKFADYESLINSDIGIRISKAGEIIEVFRTDKVVNKFLAIKGIADSITAAQKEQLKANMVEGAVKPLLFQIFRQMPDYSLAKDSTWTFAQPGSQLMVYQIQNTNTYKITALEKLNDSKLAVIEGGMITKVTGDDQISERGISYKFKKPGTSASGKIYFNITDGCIQKARTNTSINIFYSMEGKTPQGLQKGSKQENISNSYFLERL